MKNVFFILIILWCLICLTVVAISDTNNCSVNQEPVLEKTIPEKPDKSLQEPIDYVIGKLKDHDLVMIGERHWTHEEPVFIQNLIKRACEEKAVDFIFLECGYFEYQPKIEAFLKQPEYSQKPLIEALRNSTDFGWGYQEYFDIFKLVYNENKNRSEGEKIKIILVDGPPSRIYFGNELYSCLDGSSFSEGEKWQKVTWLKEGTIGRDSFMAEVIGSYLFDSKKKGIYYAGSAHIRKDLCKKDYGVRLFSTGGILSLKYPDRVCCLTFHMEPRFWQNVSDFDYLEEIFKHYEKPFAVDTNDPNISRLKLKSDINQQGVSLSEAFDGYIMLNQNKDYHPCIFVPDFYNDEFAKVVWDKLRKRGMLERLPPEYSQWKEKTPTGEELMKMIKEGLH